MSGARVSFWVSWYAVPGAQVDSPYVKGLVCTGYATWGTRDAETVCAWVWAADEAAARETVRAAHPDSSTMPDDAAFRFVTRREPRDSDRMGPAPTAPTPELIGAEVAKLDVESAELGALVSRLRVQTDTLDRLVLHRATPSQILNAAMESASLACQIHALSCQIHMRAIRGA